MKKLILLVLISLNASANEFVFRQDSFADSQALPLYFFKTKWQTPYQDGHFSFAYSNTQFSVSSNQWSFGIHHRFDIDARYTPDMIAAIHALKNHTELPTGRTYDLQMTVHHFRAWGAFAGYDFKPSETLTFRLSGGPLYGYYFASGNLEGQATALAQNDYDFRFNVDYYYSEDFLFDRRVAEPSGIGFTTNASVQWRPHSNYSAQFSIYDGFGRIYWSDAPKTVATASSNTKQYDLNGYLLYSPVLSGLETNARFVQNLPSRVSVQQQLTFGPAEIVFENRQTPINWWNRLEFAYITPTKNRVGLGWITGIDNLFIGFSNKHLNVAIAADTWQYRNVHQLLTTIEWHVPY